MTDDEPCNHPEMVYDPRTATYYCPDCDKVFKDSRGEDEV